jgi:FkbM family methyltransferase
MKSSHFLEQIRRRSGYQMPRLGIWANHVFQAIRPRAIRSEIVPGVHLELDLDETTSNNIFYLGRRYESPTLEILSSWADRGATHFYDIGANFGYFSFELTQRHPHLNALALEPNPDTFQLLQKAVSDNLLSRVHCLQVAASNARSLLRFTCDKVNAGASHVITGAIAPNQHAITVAAEPFDEILANHGLAQAPAFAKIDVEGYELATLQGMSDTLRRQQLSGLCVEINADNLSSAGTTPETIFKFLDDVGYAPISSPKIERARYRGTMHNAFFEPYS